ncbi:MAG: hypothetical protein IT318_16170 [Anaerolineales bacterium]|nr:hypothetical protein [Anaerolineales bacterium]
MVTQTTGKASADIHTERELELELELEQAKKDILALQNGLAEARASVPIADAQSAELDRLRQENAGLRSELLVYEKLKSEHQALQSQYAEMKEQWRQSLEKVTELAKTAEEQSRQEQQLLELQARLDEITAAWNPARVKEIEIERDAFGRQRDYLEERLTDTIQQVEALQRQLAGVDQEELDRLRQRAAAAERDRAALQDKLNTYSAYTAELLANKDRLRRAADLEQQVLRLQEETAASNATIADLRSQVVQLSAYRSLADRVNQELTEYKQQLDVVNESERQRLERGARAFDALRDLVEKPEYTKTYAGQIKPWPGDPQVVGLIQDYARKYDFEYSLSRIKAFLAATRSSRFIVLRGFSGSGKTSLPVLIGRAIGAPYEVIPVQPSWRSKVDLLGFFNHFDQRFLPTLFTKALIKAQLPAFQDRLFFIVLDEMNLSRVEYYFNDFNVKLQDENEPAVELFDNAAVGSLPPGGIARYIHNGNQVAISRNVVFVGTINDDETTFPLSDKIYDRAQVIDFIETADGLRHGKLPPDSVVMPALSFSGYLAAGQSAVLPEVATQELEAFLVDLNGVLRKRFFLNMSYRPGRQIVDFVAAYAAGSTSMQVMSEALDLQIISKVLPKIRYSHRTDFEDDLKEFGDELQRHWPYAKHNLGPDQTRAALELMKSRL